MGDGNYGAGRLTCHLCSDPTDSPTAPDSRCRSLLCEACRPLNPAQLLIAFGRTLTGAQKPFDADANEQVSLCRSGTLIRNNSTRGLPTGNDNSEDSAAGYAPLESRHEKHIFRPSPDSAAVPYFMLISLT